MSLYRIAFPIVGSIEQVDPGKEMLERYDSFIVDII